MQKKLIKVLSQVPILDEAHTFLKVSSSAKAPHRQPTKEDDCPICYECMYGAAETILVWCETCGNAVHKQCFAECKHFMYRYMTLVLTTLTGAKSSPRNLTCVFCRSPWIDSSAGKGKGRAGNTSGQVRTSEGYLNLATAAGLSGYRDTSTCELSYCCIVLPIGSDTQQIIRAPCTDGSTMAIRSMTMRSMMMSIMICFSQPRFLQNNRIFLHLKYIRCAQVPSIRTLHLLSGIFTRKEVIISPSL